MTDDLYVESLHVVMVVFRTAFVAKVLDLELPHFERGMKYSTLKTAAVEASQGETVAAWHSGRPGDSVRIGRSKGSGRPQQWPRRGLGCGEAGLKA